MSWDKKIQELQHRNTLAEAMGGAEKVARQHAFGKLSIRERIAAIVDPGSFYEVGKLAGVGQYDADGNLIGRVSDDPPADCEDCGSCICCIIIIVIALAAMGGNS